MYVYSGSYSDTSKRPQLVITYAVNQASLGFDSSLGPDFAPATMVAGQAVTVPVVVTNNGSGQTFNHCTQGSADCYEVGYRWFTADGRYVSIAGFTPHGEADLPQDVTPSGSGSTSSAVPLPVTAPPITGVGSYTLRLDLVRKVGGALLYASDWAQPSAYYALDKDPLDPSPSSVRWAGASLVERADFGVGVVPGGGTAVGETKTVDLADGSSLGINTYSRNLQYTGAGGVGFDDLGGRVALGYYYNSADVADCGGILGACGWGTSLDEGFTPGSNGLDFTYRDASGNRYGVDQNADGQLVSGAPVRLDRYRYTVMDDNALSGWTNGAPAVVTSGAYSGSVAFSAASTLSATTASTASAVDASHYVFLSFAVKSTATGAGIGFYVVNRTTGYANYLVYTVGTDFTVNSPYAKIALGGSVSSWRSISQRNLLADLAAQGFGSTYDSYELTRIGLWGNGQSGKTDYYDAVRLEGRASGIYSDGQPAWTAHSGLASTNTTDKAAGSSSIQVAPAPLSGSPACAGCLNGDVVAYPYLRWAWKKVGGSTIAQEVALKDARTGNTGTITYYAGPAAPAGAPDCPGTTTPCVVQVAATVPPDWTYVTRNLLEDGRQLLGFYNDHDTSGSSTAPSGGPTPDGVTVTGYTLASIDGQYGLFDAESITTLPYLGDQYGQTSGDDFVATFRGGAQHRFDQSGHLTVIEDADNNQTRLTWAYNAAHTSETLSKVAPPTDGASLSSGTARREIAVASAPGSVTFTEQLGSTTSYAGRSTVFTLSGSDVTAISPARHSGACGTSGATGCASLSYNGSTHLLTGVGDPADPGYSPSSPTTAIDWSAGPTAIRSNRTGGRLLQVSYGATGFPMRVEYVDSDGASTGANGYARFDDLSPNGSVLTTWAPVPCTSAAGDQCSGFTTASGPVDKLVSYQTDGIDNYSTETHFRLTTAQMGGNPLAGTAVSRQGSFASAKVDNLSDPLTAGLTAWDQTSEQYAASVAAGDAGLYRTSYTYSPLGLVTSTTTPYTNSAGGTVSQTISTLYDVEGHVVESDDNAVADGGFESGLTGWAASGTVTWDGTTSSSGRYSAKLAASSDLSQVVTVPPGQTVRIQVAARASSGSAHIKVQYADLGAVFHDIAGASWSPSGSSWSTTAADVTIPQGGNGQVKLDMSTGSGDAAWFDGAALLTVYAANVYNANGTRSTHTDILGRVTAFTYAPGTAYPSAALPTRAVSDYVDGVYDPAHPDQDVATTTVYDAWGRPVSSTDADGVSGATAYASNLTDVASTADGLGDATHFSYDADGNKTSTTDPLGRITGTTYDALGDPVDTTAPDGTVTHLAYDRTGRRVDELRELGERRVGNGRRRQRPLDERLRRAGRRDPHRGRRGRLGRDNRRDLRPRG